MFRSAGRHPFCLLIRSDRIILLIRYLLSTQYRTSKLCTLSSHLIRVRLLKLLEGFSINFSLMDASSSASRRYFRKNCFCGSLHGDQ